MTNDETLHVSKTAQWLARSILGHAAVRNEEFADTLYQAANVSGVTIDELQLGVQKELQAKVDNLCDMLEEEDLDDLCLYAKKMDGHFRYIGCTYELAYRSGFTTSEIVGTIAGDHDPSRSLQLNLMLEKAWGGNPQQYVKRGPGVNNHLITHCRITPIYKSDQVDHLKMKFEIVQDESKDPMPDELSMKQIQQRVCNVYDADPSACRACDFSHVCQFGSVTLG